MDLLNDKAMFRSEGTALADNGGQDVGGQVMQDLQILVRSLNFSLKSCGTMEGFEQGRDRFKCEH